MTSSIGLVVTCVILLAPVDQSMRERARAAENGKASNSIEVDNPAFDIPELLTSSDLVIHGRILKVSGRLVEKDTLVATEYEVLPLGVVKQAASISTSAVPEALPRIVVRRIGGTLIEGQYQYSTANNDYPEKGLQPGDEAVLFLRYRPNEHVFNITAGPFGVFPVSAGHVTALNKEVAVRRHDGPPVELRAFIADLKRQLKGGPGGPQRQD